MALKFEWDENKANSNFIKHDVSFVEAETVFFNPLAYIFDVEFHSIDEKREIIIGHSIKGRVLLGCFTERAPSIIRIINARSATKKERQDYEESKYFRNKI